MNCTDCYRLVKPAAPTSESSPGATSSATVRVYETGISHAGRTHQEGKKIGWRDGLIAIFHIERS